MIKRVLTLIISLFIFVTCNQFFSNQEEEKFLSAYALITKKYSEKIIKCNNQETARQLLDTKQKELESLLKKCEKASDTSKLKIIKVRILMELNLIDEAEKKLAKLINSDSNQITEIKSLKIQILIRKKKITEALNIFKQTESKIKNNKDLLNIYILFSTHISDTALKKLYSQKFLDHMDSNQLSNEYRLVTPFILRGLADIAAANHNIKDAKEYYQKAIKNTHDKRLKQRFEKEIKQLELLQNPAIPLRAETWLNAKTGFFKTLAGKVVILNFWAPWSEPSKQIIQTLKDQHGRHKTRELGVIGVTRLYGKYRDDIVYKDVVSKREEIELLKNFIASKQINYPIAITTEGIPFNDYSVTVLPTTVLIDNRGNVDSILSGTRHHGILLKRIESLMEKK